MKRFKLLWHEGASIPVNPDNYKVIVRETGCDSDALVCGRYQKRFFESLGIFGRVYDLIEDFAHSYSSIDDDISGRLPASARRDVYEYVEHNSRLRSKPIEFVNKAVLHHYAFAERIINENRYDFLCGEVAHPITRLLMSAGERFNMRFLWPMMSFWPNRFFMLSGGKYALQEAVLKSYEHVKSSGITKEEKDWALSYIDEFRRRLPSTSNVEHGLFKPSGPDSSGVVGKAKTAADLICNSRSYYRFNYYKESFGEVLKERALSYVPFSGNIRQGRPDYERPVKDEKYILYYLHYDPDVATLVWAPYFKDQVLFIKNLAFSLPFGYRLYVKEHPLMKTRPRGFYEEIQKIPQVRLLAPSESRGDLLKNCALVVTITGTVGWEALLLRKKVISFGNVFFGTFKGNTSLRCWDGLQDTIGSLIKEKDMFADEELAEFVIAVRRITMPGDWYNAIMPTYNEQNARLIGRAFYERMLMESER